MKKSAVTLPVCCGWVLTLLFWPQLCQASQQEIDSIVNLVDAGFRQTFDGKTLRRWQETYQSACQQDLPHLARLLQDDGVQLRFDPYDQHRDMLREALPNMQSKHIQAMDLHVQLSQKWLGLPAASPQASALRAQMAAQEKTVKVYDSIVTTLQERLSYLDRCVQQSERLFADAARARQDAQATRPSFESVPMPTGNTPAIDYDPKKGISIGAIGQLEPSITTHSVPPTIAATSNPPPTPTTVDLAEALQQAAQRCKEAYQKAYDQLLKNKRNTINESKNEIPKLEACIRQKRQEIGEWEQKRQELLPQLETAREDLRNLQQELASWQAKATRMEDQAPKNDAARKFQLYQQEIDRVEQTVRSQQSSLSPLERKLHLIDETLAILKQQMIDCEIRLQLFREKIASAEKALGDSVQRTIEAHRQKRFAEIDRLLANRDLMALQRCAAQGYVDLDDLLRNLYQ